MDVFFTYGGCAAWILLVLAVTAFVVFLTRLFDLRRASSDYRDFLRGVQNLLEKDNPGEALAICDDTSAPVARIIGAAVRNRNASPVEIREAVDMVGRSETRRLQRRFALVAVIAQIAPLLGLFGTVIGLLHTVTALDAAEIVSRVDLVRGLSESLVCVAAGLAVSIPSHVFCAILNARLDRVVSDLEMAAGEMIAFLTAGKGLA